MNKVTFVLTTLSIAAAGVALAQAPPTSTTSSGDKAPHMQFGSLDTNKDGRISKDEIKANAELSSSFGGLDTDHDGKLSEMEYGKWKAAPASGAMAPATGKPSGAAMPAHPDGVTAPAADATSAPKDSGSKY